MIINMFEYFKNNKVVIYFDDIPHVGIRYFVPSMTDDERKSIEKYPFINKRNLHVKLYDCSNTKTYQFVIPKGYCYDGASIPRLFWRVIGANTDNKYLIPALVHDVICENHKYVDYDRKFSTEVFNALLEAGKVNSFKRFIMKNSVDSFQCICCRWE